MTVATVIVPTHDAAHSLDLAVESALRQSVADIEVVIVGDGVTDDARDIIDDLLTSDERVRFIDRPKGAHQGEAHRDEAVRSAAAPVICYLGDHDLLLPHHVATMIDLLADTDLAHSLNGVLDADGWFSPLFSDLSSVDFCKWLMHPERTSVSFTGTAHTRAAYMRLPVGWEAPPPGRRSDHGLWQKLLALPDLRATTSDQVSALQLPTLPDRAGWTPDERRDELLLWLDEMHDPAGPAAFDDIVRGALNRKGAELQVVCTDQLDRLEEEARRSDDLHLRIDELNERIADLKARTAELESSTVVLAEARDEVSAERDELAQDLARVESSRMWRLRNRLVRGSRRR